MVLVARDQQDGTLVTVGVRSKPGNLSSVVDVVRFRYCHVRARKNQGLQVDDGTSVLPQEPTVRTAPQGDESPTICSLELIAYAVLQVSPRYNSKIGHHAVLPEKTMACRHARV